MFGSLELSSNLNRDEFRRLNEIQNCKNNHKHAGVVGALELKFLIIVLANSVIFDSSDSLSIELAC